MCTSLIFSPHNHYFGRNLDLEVSFGQQIVIAPRSFVFHFRKMPPVKKHYALVGVALVKENYPLYFDAANETGLAMAGLNYPDNAHFYSERAGKDNISPFEFIPWILGQARDIKQAKKLLQKINLVNINFSAQMQLSPLHWLLADKSGSSIVVEADRNGMHVYDNPVGVLTNNPPFPLQLFNLNNYPEISSQMPVNKFSPQVDFASYSRGLGSRNLPGGMDSESRFVRATFNKFNAPTSADDDENVITTFHIMHSVEQPKGLDQVAPGQFEYTIYTSVVNLDRFQFYYTSYNNKQITGIDANKSLNGERLVTFPFAQSKVQWQN